MSADPNKQLGSQFSEKRLLQLNMRGLVQNVASSEGGEDYLRRLLRSELAVAYERGFRAGARSKTSG